MRGRALQRRAERLGASARDLAKLTGLSRGAVDRAFSGVPVRGATLGLIEATLDRLENGTHAVLSDGVPTVVSNVTLLSGTTISFTGTPTAVAESAAHFLETHQGD